MSSEHRRIDRSILSLARIIVLMLAAVPPPALAQTRSPTEEQIRIAVVDQLQRHNLRRGKIEVSVAGSTVTLAGEVQNLWEKNEAIKFAFAVKGVEMVASDLVIPKAESDKAIADQLGKGILRYSRYTIYDDIDAHVLNGIVTLEGSVTDGGKSDALAEMASRIRGVQDLKNNLMTLPPMPGDDRLRNAIARRMFSQPGFEAYAVQVNPPIHIIVAYGRVTLKGYVRSAMDKLKAEIVAREIPGVMNVDNKLQIDK